MQIEAKLRPFREAGPTSPVPITKETKAKPGEHQIRLRAVARPDPDMDRITKVLLDIGKTIVDEEPTKQEDDDSKAA